MYVPCPTPRHGSRPVGPRWPLTTSKTSKTLPPPPPPPRPTPPVPPPPILRPRPVLADSAQTRTPQNAPPSSPLATDVITVRSRLSPSLPPPPPHLPPPPPPVRSPYTQAAQTTLLSGRRPSPQPLVRPPPWPHPWSPSQSCVASSPPWPHTRRQHTHKNTQRKKPIWVRKWSILVGIFYSPFLATHCLGWDSRRQSV